MATLLEPKIELEATPEGRFFNPEPRQPFHAELYEASQATLINALNLLPERSGRLLTFGITVEGQVTWFERDDPTPERYVSLDYDATKGSSHYGWKLTLAGPGGLTSYSAFVYADGYEVVKTAHWPNGQSIETDQPVSDPTNVVSTILALAKSDVLAAKIDELTSRKQVAEERLGMLMLDLYGRGWTAARVKKDADRAEEAVKKACFMNMGRVVLADNPQTDPGQRRLFEMKPTYRNFKTGQSFWRYEYPES